MRSRAVFAVLLAATLASVRESRAQAVPADRIVARALVLLDSTETERALELLRQAVALLSTGGPSSLRLEAEMQLGATSYVLGLADSADAHFQEAAAQDVFYDPDPAVFNPDLLGAFRAARRAVYAVGIRTPSDTVLRPGDQLLPVTVGVASPSRVAIRLRQFAPVQRDSSVDSLFVDRIAVRGISLSVGPGRALAPGRYQLTVHLVGVPEPRSTYREFAVEQLPADTLPHRPELPDSLFRRERRSADSAKASLLRGIAFGSFAAASPLLVTNPGLGAERLQLRALGVGAALAVGGVAGYFLARPGQPIAENIRYNASLRQARAALNAEIARANEVRRQLAPLRVRFTPEER